MMKIMSDAYLKYVIATIFTSIMKTGIFMVMLQYAVLYNIKRYKKHIKKGNKRKARMIAFVIGFSIVALMYMMSMWRV